jgi:hypothetical protein
MIPYRLNDDQTLIRRVPPVGRFSRKRLGRTKSGVDVFIHVVGIWEGVYAMAPHAKGSRTWQSTLADAMVHGMDEALSGATVETLEILMDGAQSGQLFRSLDDVRRGRVLSFEAAFGDL